MPHESDKKHEDSPSFKVELNIVFEVGLGFPSIKVMELQLKAHSTR